MPRVTCHMSVSVDGFVAGPDQSREDPVGRGGMALHDWHQRAVARGEPTDIRMRDELLAPRGAYIMGRNMFGPVRGGWDEEDWRGWWGPEPPYHAPVFVLTHHAKEPIEMEGGTTFHFVTDGLDGALARAREVAGERDIDVAGGASTVQQALRAGVIDELVLDIAPLIVGAGERLLDGVPAGRLEPLEVAGSPQATHVRYRLGAPAG